MKMKRKELIKKALLFFIGVFAISFSLVWLIFTKHKVLASTFLVISILFTSYIYFWITIKKEKKIRVEDKKKKKEVRFYSQYSSDINISNIQEDIPFYVLNKLQKRNCFKCYAYFGEDENCIVLEIKYQNLDKDYFYFYDYNLFFEIFEVIEE